MNFHFVQFFLQYTNMKSVVFFPIFKPLNQIFVVKNSKHDAFLAHKQLYDYLQR